MNKFIQMIKVLFVVILAVSLFGGAMFALYNIYERVSVVKPSENCVYYRRHVVLIDMTGSMIESISSAKNTLIKMVNKKMGIGDCVITYRLGDKLDEKNDRITSEDECVKVPQNITDIKTKKISKEYFDIMNICNKKMETTKKSWIERINQINKSPGNVTDYKGIIKTTSNWFLNREENNVENNLIVIGDMKQSPLNDNIKVNNSMLAGVNVWMVYPSACDRPEKIDNMVEEWEKYFKNMGCKKYEAWTFDQFIEMFPENHISKIVCNKIYNEEKVLLNVSFLE